MLRMSVDERRRRIARRHHVSPAHPAANALAAARAVVGLHGTDPATTFLAAHLRSTDSFADIEKALYDDRTLIRVLAMRRTVFAVPHDLVPACLAGAADVVARQQRTTLFKILIDSGISDDPPSWLIPAEAAALRAFDTNETLTSAELAATDPLLATRVTVGHGTTFETTGRLASRLLTLLSAEGRVVRARPKGSWTSTQFRWSTLERWRPDAIDDLATDDAAAMLARRWLEQYGPATEDDLVWWMGWTKTRARAALAACDLVEVDLDGQIGFVLAEDQAETPEVDPWVALLPALDPTVMGWKHRDFYLGEHRKALFDVNGNAGPTVWCDGRIVGGWAQRDDGEIAVRLIDDIGVAASTAVQERAAALTATLGDVRLKARARGWTPVERELRSTPTQSR